jgi:hypothetical protein
LPLGGWGLHRDDDVDTAANQFRRKSGEPGVLALRRSDLDLDIFPRDIAKLGERLAKRPKGSGPPTRRMPMRCIRSACCAPAASGHAAVAPPSSVMNWRRVLIQ